MPMTMLEIYQAAVAEGRLHEDSAQLGVMAELDRVRVEVAVPVKRGLFRKPPPPVKGLYMWGGVGRGKSMLMDLFVETLEISRKRRVHFHEFKALKRREVNSV